MKKMPNPRTNARAITNLMGNLRPNSLYRFIVMLMFVPYSTHPFTSNEPNERCKSFLIILLTGVGYSFYQNLAVCIPLYTIHISCQHKVIHRYLVEVYFSNLSNFNPTMNLSTYSTIVIPLNFANFFILSRASLVILTVTVCLILMYTIVYYFTFLRNISISF